MRACEAALAVLLCEFLSIAAAASAPDCAAEAEMLSKARSELPQLEIASPHDKPPCCITLETIISFANRVKTHLAHCPSSDFAPAAADWVRTQADYSKLFAQHRCRRTM